MGLDRSRVERVHMRLPGPQTLAVIERLSAARKRYIAQGDIPLGPGGFCSWCNVAPVKPPLRKYCDPTCRSSADLYTYPQSPASKAYVFMELQDFTCPLCGEIFEDEWAERHEKLDASNDDRFKEGWDKTRRLITYFQLGINCGDRWQVDHRIPISEGGALVGFENIQVVCAPCHVKKSAAENSLRLKALFKAGASPPQMPATPIRPEK